MDKRVLSSDEKAKLLVVLPSIKFVEDDDVRPYRCMVCGQVAIYHYFTTCQHLFCGNCLSFYAEKACPIAGCYNASIDKVAQHTDSDLSLYSLKAHCIYKDNGCEEIVTLSEIMDHSYKCKFSTRNLLPKIWTPKIDAEDFAKMMNDLNELKKVVATLQRNNVMCNCSKSEQNSREEIEQIKSDFERKLNGLKENLLVDVTMLLTSKIDAQIQNSIKIKFDENCKTTQNYIDESAEKLRRNLKENLANIHEKNSEALKRLELQTQTAIDEIKKNVQQEILDQKLNSSDYIESQLIEKGKILEEKINESSVIKLKENVENLQQKNSTAMEILCGDITKFNNDDISEQPFPDLNIQVLNKKVENVFNYLIQDKSTEFTWNIPGIYEKTRRLKDERMDPIQGDCLTAVGAKIKIQPKIEWYFEQFRIYLDTMDSTPCHLFSDLYESPSYQSPFDSFNRRVMSQGAQRFLVARNGSLCMNQSEIYHPHFILLDQSNNKIKKNACRTSQHQFDFLDQSSFSSEFFPVKYLERNSPYVKNDSIKIIIRLVPNSILYRSIFSDNGILFWKLGNYKQFKKDALDGVFSEVLSECFYLMDSGCKMRVALTFQETLASFHIRFVQGETDDGRTFHVYTKITIVIFDQSNSEEKRHLTKSAHLTLPGSSNEIFRFVYDQHENDQYLKNDCLLIKVTTH